MRVWLTAISGLALAGFLGWASDAITLQGERTVYTLTCIDGQWQDSHCGGHVAAGDRYRFRALKAHAEVVFWTAGSSAPSGKFSGCKIQDGRNWTCPASAEARQTVTLQMQHGVPVRDPSGRTTDFHAVAKWRWYLAGLGLPIGNSADN